MSASANGSSVGRTAVASNSSAKKYEKLLHFHVTLTITVDGSEIFHWL